MWLLTQHLPRGFQISHAVIPMPTAQARRAVAMQLRTRLVQFLWPVAERLVSDYHVAAMNYGRRTILFDR